MPSLAASQHPFTSLDGSNLPSLLSYSGAVVDCHPLQRHSTFLLSLTNPISPRSLPSYFGSSEAIITPFRYSLAAIAPPLTMDYPPSAVPLSFCASCGLPGTFKGTLFPPLQCFRELFCSNPRGHCLDKPSWYLCSLPNCPITIRKKITTLQRCRLHIKKHPSSHPSPTTPIVITAAFSLPTPPNNLQVDDPVSPTAPSSPLSFQPSMSHHYVLHFPLAPTVVCLALSLDDSPSHMTLLCICPAQTP